MTTLLKEIILVFSGARLEPEIFSSEAQLEEEADRSNIDSLPADEAVDLEGNCSWCQKFSVCIPSWNQLQRFH